MLTPILSLPGFMKIAILLPKFLRDIRENNEIILQLETPERMEQNAFGAETRIPVAGHLARDLISTRLYVSGQDSGDMMLLA